MAAIEDLIKQIADPGLRDQIAAEVARLKATKTFGLVFEEHLPELVRLPTLPLRVGVRVMKKDVTGTTTYRVTAQVNGKKVKIVPEAGGPEETVERDGLVVAKAFGEPMYPALVPVDAIERAGKPWHVLINADNYHALQLLLYGYEGKVDVIYIDPPYNSGARDWKYNNNYVDADDGWRHSKWLAMMKRRLLLAKRLLNQEESVLIVTIDEKEYLRLGLLLKELFVESRVQMITSVISPSGAARNIEFTRVNEFVFFVMIGKAIPCKTADDMLFTESRPQKANRSPIWNSLRRLGAGPKRADSPSKFYAVLVDETGRIVGASETLPFGVAKETYVAPAGTIAIWPQLTNGEDARWELRRSSFLERLEKGYVRAVGTSESGKVNIQYLRNAQIERLSNGELFSSGEGNDGSLQIDYSPDQPRSLYAKTVWNKPSHDSRTYGSWILREFVPDRQFPFPKSLYAVEDALRFFVKHRPNALVLDFFAGSGTTAHAVFRLNHQDGGRRRCFLVTNNELSPEEAERQEKSKKMPGDPAWEALGICEHVTWPRIKSAISGKTPHGTPVGGSYKFTDEFSMSQGFKENAAYFKLDFLDPGDVKRGEKFESIVPILWMLAGCRGACEVTKRTGKWFIPKHNPFAVLHDEDAFGDFVRKLAERPDVDHVFLVTDSTEGFHEMAAELGNLRGGGKIRCIQLYRSYIDTFRINLAEPGTITPNGVPVVPTASPAAQG